MFIAYTLDTIYRVRSRAVVIPFHGPSVGPADAVEDELFDFLERVIDGYHNVLDGSYLLDMPSSKRESLL